MNDLSLKKYIIKNMNITSDTYDLYISDACSVEKYDPNIKYGGKGDSDDKSESLSSKLVPELNERGNYFCYIHDMNYTLIYNKNYGIDKPRADLLFYWMMRYEFNWFIAKIYYLSVKYFGKI